MNFLDPRLWRDFSPPQRLAYFEQSRALYAAFDLVEYVKEEQEMIDYIKSNETA